MNAVDRFRVMATHMGEEAIHEDAPDTPIQVRFKTDFLDGVDFVGEGFVLTVADVDIPANPIGSQIIIAGEIYYIRQKVGGKAGVTKYQVEKTA